MTDPGFPIYRRPTDEELDREAMSIRQDVVDAVDAFKRYTSEESRDLLASGRDDEECRLNWGQSPNSSFQRTLAEPNRSSGSKFAMSGIGARRIRRPFRFSSEHRGNCPCETPASTGFLRVGEHRLDTPEPSGER